MSFERLSFDKVAVGSDLLVHQNATRALCSNLCVSDFTSSEHVGNCRIEADKDRSMLERVLRSRSRAAVGVVQLYLGNDRANRL